LRDACHCTRCRDAGSGQRLVDVLDIASDVLVDATVDHAGVSVVFDSSDGRHEGWVPERALASLLDGPRLSSLWHHDHLDRLHDGAVDMAATDDLTPLLQAIDSFGIGLARRLPTEPGQVLDFAGRIGFVRETNYGRLFDVIVEPDPINLAFTPLGLPLHTDNPYRDPVPTVQLLHCLSAATTGGGSRFADGFAAAERLREEDPAAFESLATHDVAFRFHDDTTDLRARGTIIETTARGELTGIRLNHRSMEPPDMPTDVLDDWYRSYRSLCTILARPDSALEITLEPGDLIVFDNRRVLHGRSAFAVTARRHLQGCYADIDSIRSAVRIREPS
jgi:gamma-butyrobetaine dioxygenase